MHFLFSVKMSSNRPRLFSFQCTILACLDFADNANGGGVCITGLDWGGTHKLAFPISRGRDLGLFSDEAAS